MENRFGSGVLDPFRMGKKLFAFNNPCGHQCIIQRQNYLDVLMDTEDGDEMSTEVRVTSSNNVQQQHRLAYDVTALQPLCCNAVLRLPHHYLGPTTMHVDDNESQVGIHIDEPAAGPSWASDHYLVHPAPNLYFLRSVCRHSGHPTCLLDNLFAHYKPDITHYYDVDFGMYPDQRLRRRRA